MNDLPDARPDGQCTMCVKKPAETKDGRFCARCLRLFLYRLNPDPKPMPSEHKWRPSRSPKVLGGAPDMRTYEQMDPEEE